MSDAEQAALKAAKKRASQQVTYLSTYLPTYLPTYQKEHHSRWPTYLPTVIYTCLATFLPTYLPIYLAINTNPLHYLLSIIIIIINGLTQEYYRQLQDAEDAKLRGGGSGNRLGWNTRGATPSWKSSNTHPLTHILYIQPLFTPVTHSPSFSPSLPMTREVATG